MGVEYNHLGGRVSVMKGNPKGGSSYGVGTTVFQEVNFVHGRKHRERNRD
jgi:hypothetical protein